MLEMKCIICGKPQEKDRERSTDGVVVYPLNVNCECGGKFEPFLDGKPIGRWSDE